MLVGMMGSGKSTISRLLSAATGWPTYDNDELLLQTYGMTPKQILESSGEQQMRDAEDAALAIGLASEPPCFVDAAAGTIMSEASRRLLSAATVVWLRATPETLFRRAAGAPHRPWLDGGEEWMRNAAAERYALYESVADLVVDTDDRPPSEVADEVLSRLGELCPELRAPVS